MIEQEKISEPPGKILGVALENGIQQFSNEIYAGMVMAIVLATLLPPFVVKWYYGSYGH